MSPSPELLLDGLKLIGRQLPVKGGALDLLGLDQDGGLVLLELKRGTLTRDAVAQILDYVSDLASRDPEQLVLLIQECSGRGGIEQIEDFNDWYAREYPDAPPLLEKPPGMVLVGLGVDDRAKRIVNFLADSGIDIQLQTFHAFDSGGTLFLAKQVETLPPMPPRPSSRGPTKEENRQMLLELASQHGVQDLLVTVSDFIAESLPCYRWPGKTAFSFSLQEQTEQGRFAYRSYVTLYVSQRERGMLQLTLAPRALDAAGQAVHGFVEKVPSASTQASWTPFLVEIDSNSWPSIRDQLSELLEALVAGWKEKAAKEGAEEAEPDAIDALSSETT